MPEPVFPGAIPAGFSALASLPELGGVLRPGRLSVLSSSVRFECDQGSVEWPQAELVIQLGGYNGRQIMLTRNGHPQSSISTSELALLEHDGLCSGPLRQQIVDLQKQARTLPTGWIVSGIACLIVLAGVVGLLTQKGRLSRSVAAQIPLAWEIQLGQTIQAQVAKTSTLVVEHGAFAAQLRRVTNALVPALRGFPIPFQFHIVEDNTLNAFAVPGGQVFVHTGLLRTVKRPEELAGVLAHEIAHVTQRHSLRKMIESAGLGILVRALVGDAEGILALAGDTSQFLLNQTFSRDFEREADDVGWDYLVDAQIDPRGMIDFFASMNAEQQRSAAGRLANTLPILSTHPATEERMERLRAKWDALAQKERFQPLGP